MRATGLILLTLVLAFGVWKLVGDEESLRAPAPSEIDPPEPQDPRVAETEKRAYPTGSLPTSTTLTVRVLSRSGHVPDKAEAGYVFGGRERLRRVDARGLVTFTDAPLGELEIVGRAPGFERSSQRRYLNAGLSTEVVMALKLKAGFKPPGEDR